MVSNGSLFMVIRGYFSNNPTQPCTDCANFVSRVWNTWGKMIFWKNLKSNAFWLQALCDNTGEAIQLKPEQVTINYHVATENWIHSSNWLSNLGIWIPSVHRWKVYTSGLWCLCLSIYICLSVHDMMWVGISCEIGSLSMEMMEMMKTMELVYAYTCCPSTNSTACNTRAWTCHSQCSQIQLCQGIWVSNP